GVLGGPWWPRVPQFQIGPITSGLPELLFQTATSVSPMKTPPAGIQVQPLAETTADAWLNTDLKTIHYQQGVDPKGPLPVAVSVTRTTPPATPAATPAAAAGTPTPTSGPKASDMRIVFVGDVAFATNPALPVAGGNKSLLTNSVNWLTENVDLIQIPPKVPTDRMLILSSTQLNVLLYGSAVFIPLVVLAAGIAVWWSRR